MKLASARREADRHPLIPAIVVAWIATLGAAAAVAAIYFLVARFGLILLSAPSDIAVFWPASGVAAGILILSGRGALQPVVIGVLAGTLAANLMSDRSLLTSLFKGFCNSGEAFVAAWLLERWFGKPFTFSDLRRVVGFLGAAALATAASATGGAATMTLLHTGAPYWEAWRTWFLSDGIGLVAVAPFVIGLGQMWREPPSRRESIEGTGVLGLTALACFFVMSHESGSWVSIAPGAFVLPPLLWLTARCPPSFGMAGAFVISVTVISATTFGIGHFGDAAVPMLERVKGAQVATTMVTIYTLVLAAVFAQRLRAEQRLQHREAELAEAQRVARIGSWYWDAQTDGIVGSDEMFRIYGFDPATTSPADFRGQLDSRFPVDEWERLKEASRSTMQTGVRYELELRAFRNGTPIWVATRGEVVRDGGNQTTGLRGTVQDITERKLAELSLAERNAQLDLAAKAALVGSYTYDVNARMLQFSEGYAAIYDLPEGTREMTGDARRALVHPEDLELLDRIRSKAYEQRRGEFSLEYRNVLPKRGVRWIESRSLIFYDSNGHPERLVGVNIDITERKLAELALAERNAQLALAGEEALVGSYAYESDLERMSVSEGYAVMHGLPAGTMETTRSEWRTRVHPDDLERLEGFRARTLGDKRNIYNMEYRIVRASGEVRWIESRSIISYDDNGRPQRVIGINIDVTQRKQAEALLKESETRLSDALAAGHVVAFEWNADTGRSRRSDNADRIMGLVDGGRFMSQVTADDRGKLTSLVRGLSPHNPSYALTFRFVRADGHQVWLEETAKGEFDATGRLLRIKGLTRNITERKELEDHKNTLISELDHRVKNVLAAVSAVASRTLETSSSMAEFVAALDGRIKSMAAAHQLLSHRRWQGIPLAELVRYELAPYATASNTRIDGSDVVLSAEAGQTLAMVFHELATNAAKFGAISVKSGCVSVRWSLRGNGHAKSCLCIDWEESGGPPVVSPARSGFGTSVVRELVPYELGGTVDLMHPPEGVRCKLQIPTHWLSDSIS